MRRRTLPPPAGSQVYELTEWGAQLDDIVVALGRWGAGAPEPSADDVHVGADSAMIKLRSFFSPQPERPWTATYEVRLGRYRFTARVADGHLVDMSRGEPHDLAGAVATAAADKAADTLIDGFEEHLAEGARQHAETTSAALRNAVTDATVVALYNAFGAERAAALGVPAPPPGLLDGQGHLRIPMGDDAAYNEYVGWLYHSKGGNPLRMWTSDALKDGGLLDPFFEGLIEGEKR